MKVAAMIPARMGSSRFPGKPLAPILGRPMIEHVYRRTALCGDLAEVFIATCDGEIMDAVDAFGGKAVMTSDKHERASDRIAEAMTATDADVIVMVQGDEPMVHPEMISEAVAPMRGDGTVQCVNLTKRITSEEEFLNPNTIKVVMALDGRALYMSRQPIPDRPKNDFSAIRAYKQVCIMPFRRGALERFATLPPTPLEVAESIDMMRFPENGDTVHMVETNHSSFAVDTPGDLARVENLMRDDRLVAEYA